MRTKIQYIQLRLMLFIYIYSGIRGNEVMKVFKSVYYNKNVWSTDAFYLILVVKNNRQLLWNTRIVHTNTIAMPRILGKGTL